MPLYVLDLETTALETAKSRMELLNISDITFVCSLAYCEVSENPSKIFTYYGKEEAAHYICELPQGIYYTWNGAKFDTQLIFHILRKNGFKERNENKRFYRMKIGDYEYLLANNKLILAPKKEKYLNNSDLSSANDSIKYISPRKSEIIDSYIKQLKKH